MQSRNCLNPSGYLNLLPVFSGDCVVRSLVFCIVFCRLLYVLLAIVFSAIFRFAAFDYPLVSSNFSYVIKSRFTFANLSKSLQLHNLLKVLAYLAVSTNYITTLYHRSQKKINQKFVCQLRSTFPVAQCAPPFSWCLFLFDIERN